MKHLLILLLHCNSHIYSNVSICESFCSMADVPPVPLTPDYGGPVVREHSKSTYNNFI
ncbi:hypothetical protein Lalb_Chr07g0192841 [Lupinus albus]|uniref:Uncharacterized protein n=1 Tax=Lupinus albus TaxID=3870 RepID=A0A6A4QCI2_LUPAL|nr:hypothetical protein Lalb_Chr07g0192841 [Lupinus albus]